MINLKTFIKDQKEFLENDGYSDDYKKRFDELFPSEKMETNSFIETFREYWNEFVNDYGDLAVFEKVITNNVFSLKVPFENCTFQPHPLPFINLE